MLLTAFLNFSIVLVDKRNGILIVGKKGEVFPPIDCFSVAIVLSKHGKEKEQYTCVVLRLNNCYLWASLMLF